MNLSPKTIIDERFEIVCLIGQGGTGQVYKAQQKGLDRLVAMKFLLPDIFVDAEMRTRFEREGKILSALNHPNISGFYHFGFRDQFPYIVMEFIEGQSLSKVFQDGPMSWRRAVKIALQICDAVGHAHQHGFIHRDLKPGNILLVDGTEDIVKVVDFGLAGSSAFDGGRLTSSGVLIGTANYMSPEICRGMKADERSDIYALGCILYEAIAGAPPYSADSPIGVIHQHAVANIPLIGHAIEDSTLPQSLQETIAKAMAKERDQRQRSMDQLSMELRASLSDVRPARACKTSRVSGGIMRRCLVALGMIAVLTGCIFALLNKSSMYPAASRSNLDKALRPISDTAMLNQIITSRKYAKYSEALRLIALLTKTRRAAAPDMVLCLAHLEKANILATLNRPFKQPNSSAVKKETLDECAAGLSYGTANEQKLKPTAIAYTIMADLEGDGQKSLANYCTAAKILSDAPYFPLEQNLQQSALQDLQQHIGVNLNYAYQNTGAKAQQKALLLSLLRQEPDNLLWKGMLARYYVHNGETEKGIRLAQSMEEQFPDKEQTVNCLIDVLFEAGRTNEALQIIQAKETAADLEIRKIEPALQSENFSDGNFVRYTFSPNAGGRRTLYDRAKRSTGQMYFILSNGEYARGHIANGLRLQEKASLYENAEQLRHSVVDLNTMEVEYPEFAAQLDAMRKKLQGMIHDRS